jgi:hypothetical protein
MRRGEVRHIKKPVAIRDIIIQPHADMCISSPPPDKKKVTNVYYDPATKEIVFEVEE